MVGRSSAMSGSGRVSELIMIQRLLMSAALAIVLGGGNAWAQDDTDRPDDIADRVAAALVERGDALFEQGDYTNAKKMFAESLERSPSGPSSQQALEKLRASNEKLGIANLDDGRPSSTGQPVDPYAGGNQGGDAPVDPYAGDVPSPVDPYAGGAEPAGPPTPGPAPISPKDEPPEQGARRTLLAWTGVYGLGAGLALAGPQGDDGDISGAAFLVGGLGAAAGVGLGHLLFRARPMTPGQVAASISGGTWGAIEIGLLTDVFSVDDTETNHVYKGAAIGGLAGFGGGLLYAYKGEPEEGDVALANSLGLYGGAGGLLLGVAMSPAEAEAYSLNAVIGSTLGVAGGVLLRDRIDTSRRRLLLVDLGALAGAAIPWALIYPLVSDGGTNNDEQAIGLVSTLTLFGGAVTAWLLTGDGEREAVSARDASPPALVSRSAGGRWSLGSVALRPMHDPALAPAAGVSVGLDLAAGRF